MVAVGDLVFLRLIFMRVLCWKEQRCPQSKKAQYDADPADVVASSGQ